MKINNNKLITCLLLAFTFICTQVAFAAPQNSYDKIVFFGDSLTDNGNMYSVSLGFLPKSPPYHKGRFSNDIVWSERVSKHFNQYNVSSSNYAVGGLTTILHNPFGGYLPYTLTASMYDYLARSLFRDRSQTLFIIWVGSNDYMQGAKNVDTLTTNVVGNIKYVVENLIYYGGTNFLIINLPDISISPYSKEKNMGGNLSALVEAHNQKLNEVVTELNNSYKNTTIRLYDSHKLMADALSDIDAANKKYNTNIKNITESCWTGGYTLRQEEASSAQTIQRDLESHMSAQLKGFAATPEQKSLDTAGFSRYVAENPALFETYAVGRRVNEYGQTLRPCSNPNEYAFWDRIHPSAPLHKIFALTMIEFIQANYQHQTKA